MPQRISGARFIAETLKGYGVTHVFFVEAILRRTLVEMETLGIRRVLTHSEKAAAYMADGYARIARRASFCMAQSVGAANLASGLQDPFLGRSPVIAITGRQVPMAQHRHAYQEVLHGPLFDSVTKYNVSVDSLPQLPHILRQAFREATTGTPGPVHLDLLGYQGQAIEEAEADLEVLVEEPFTRIPSYRTTPEAARVAEAARLLAAAERPVLVAGGGVTASRAGADLRALADRLCIPVATSLNGKSALLDDHPSNVGVVGRYSRQCANQVVAEADLVVFVGSAVGEMVTLGWTIPRPGTRIVQIDINPAELGRNYPHTLGVPGDAKATLEMLLAAVESGVQPKTAWAARARDLVRRWREELAPHRASGAVPIRPERLCKEVTDCLPPDGILVGDTGFAGIWTGTQVHLTAPGQEYIRCAGSLGWAFPASLGAKCAAPHRPVVCFTGDGGMWYHLSELETARRCGIPTVTVVNNNRALGQCAVSIRKLYAGRPGNPGDLFDFGGASFAALAREMGCLGIQVTEPEGIAPGIRQALAAEVPAVVEVLTDVNCPAPEPWTP
jgi:acetolactate synthase I/II/III large subunit